VRHASGQTDRDAAFFSVLSVAGTLVLAAAVLLANTQRLLAQTGRPAWTSQEAPVADHIGRLRDLPDDVRAHATKQLALEIRQLPAGPNKVRLANGLATLSTEGDFGHDVLQEVATTLAGSLRETPVPADQEAQPAAPYMELAELVRYEHVQASLDDPQLAAAKSKIEADDARRQSINFTLTDLSGKAWTLRDLRGKVVLVNFWATWCPPCRKEMPDLDALYRRFKDQDLVILAISDEDANTVKTFLAQREITYPILLDPGDKLKDLFDVQGIPQSYVFDRAGKMVAESIDMRTQRQFLQMLGQAGLR
jgi:peroxiredoxin